MHALFTCIGRPPGAIPSFDSSIRLRIQFNVNTTTFLLLLFDFSIIIFLFLSGGLLGSVYLGFAKLSFNLSTDRRSTLLIDLRFFAFTLILSTAHEKDSTSKENPLAIIHRSTAISPPRALFGWCEQDSFSLYIFINTT